MRVQSIGQDYQQSHKKQKEPSFQANVFFVSKDLEALRRSGDELTSLFKVGEASKEIAHTWVQIDPDTFKPYSTMYAGTPEHYDSKMIPKFEKFAKDHGFDSDIQPGGDIDGDEAVKRVRALIEKIQVL